MKLKSSCLAVESTKLSIRGMGNCYLSVGWVTVLGAGFVEIHEINAHSPFSIGFLDHDHICQPVGVVYFPNEICMEQLLNFFSYSFVSFLSEHSFSLSDRR